MRLQPWFAWSLAIGCVGWQLVARVGAYLSTVLEQSPPSVASAATGTAAITALIAALVLVMLGRGPRHPLVALMIPLTLVPFVVGGPASPVGLGGLLAAATLLTVRAPVSWLLFGAVTVTDAALGWLVSGGDVFILFSRAPVTVIVGLTLFAVARLAQLVTAANDARQGLARAEANAERLRAAGRLSAGLGAQLSGLIQRTRDAAQARTPTRDELGEIAAFAHRATAAARQAATVHTASLSPTPSRQLPEPATTATYTFAWWVSFALIISYSCLPVLNVIWSGGADAATWTLVVAAIIAIGALQLYHGTPRPHGSNPRGWPWTIAAQAGVVVFITVAARAEDVFVLWFLMTGAIVTHARRAWSWLVVPVVLLVYGYTVYLPSSHWNGWNSAYFAGTLSVAIISVYALCRLPVTAERLHRSRADLARTAVVTERLRFARDVHDLLGFHLSAIALKTELAARALDTDLAETHRQLGDVRRSAERALTEIRSINNVADDITFRAELAAARALLGAAGVRISVDAPATPPPGVDPLAGIIVREAATNVVRHAQARHCGIRTTVDGGTVSLTITNDGVLPAADPADLRGGTGIANLTARAESIGGELSAVTDGGTFTLTARLPVRRASPTVPRPPQNGAGRPRVASASR